MDAIKSAQRAKRMSFRWKNWVFGSALLLCTLNASAREDKYDNECIEGSDTNVECPRACERGHLEMKPNKEGECGKQCYSVYFPPKFGGNYCYDDSAS